MDTTNLQEMQAGDSALLNHDRIFNSNEFVAERVPSPKWLKDGTGYALLERSDAGQKIVQIDAETGNRETLGTSSQLIPAGETAPLQVKEYSLSKDCVKLLIFTNTNHYWVLNRSTWNLHKLGNDAQSGTLMNAAFSPDGQKVAYLSQSNLFHSTRQKIKDLCKLLKRVRFESPKANLTHLNKAQVYVESNYRTLRSDARIFSLA